MDFYMRGGDFPETNAESRDPHIVDIDTQAMAFGRTKGDDLNSPVDYIFPADGLHLQGTFADGLPDPVFQYDEMPDTDHPVTPEYATKEDAKEALVKFLIALTDPRVRYERAPFDHPQLFVPIDGEAPENSGGRPQLVSLAGVPCPATTAGDICFREIPAVGADGKGSPLTNFLGISSTPLAGESNDHFDCNPGVAAAAAPSLQAAPSPQAATSLAADRLEVAFKLDPAVTGGIQLGERWVSPSTYDTAQTGRTFRVEARAEIVGEGGQRETTVAQWISENPDQLSVTPGAENAATITVQRIEQTTLRVAVQGMTHELTVSAAPMGSNAIRAMFSRVGETLEQPEEVCDKRAFLPNLSGGPMNQGDALAEP